MQDSAYTKSEMAALDNYRESISVERTLLAYSFVEEKIEGRSEGIELIIVNGYNAGTPVEIVWPWHRYVSGILNRS